MKHWIVVLCLWLPAAVLADDSLLGVVSEQQILSVQPYADNWQDAVLPEPDPDDLAALQDLTLVVLFGFWCHDSEREVPRLIKALAQAPFSSVQYIAVDRDKKAPGDLHLRYGLRYTPTAILFDGEREIGRIIEQPEGDWLSHLARLQRAQR